MCTQIISSCTSLLHEALTLCVCQVTYRALRIIVHYRNSGQNGSNEAWHGDTEGHCSTFTASFHKSDEQKVRRSRKYVVFVPALMFLIADDKIMLNKLCY